MSKIYIIKIKILPGSVVTPTMLDELTIIKLYRPIVQLLI